MPKIMADHNVEGHLAVLMRFWTGPDWNDVWLELSCDVESFSHLGLAHNTPDAILWRRCQEEGILLLTGNRNAEGDDSLEVTIRENCTDQSLPVMTIGDPARLLADRDYAESVAEQILTYILDLDRLCGTGRLYVP